MNVGAIGSAMYTSNYNIRRVEDKHFKKSEETKKVKISSPHVEKRIDQLASQFKNIGLYNSEGAKIVAKSIVAGKLDIVA